MVVEGQKLSFPCIHGVGCCTDLNKRLYSYIDCLESVM